MIVTPYDYLGSPKTEDGSWAYTGSLGSYPSAPVTFDGTLDTDGYDPGIYEYTYTVTDVLGCIDSSTVNIVILEPITILNDECASAIVIDMTNSELTSGAYAYTLGGANCSEPQAATKTVSPAYPSDWGDPNDVTGDVWFKINIAKDSSDSITTIVTVNGNSYSYTGIVQPLMALYTGSCGSLVEACSTEIPSANSRFTQCNTTIGSGITNTSIFVRVAAVDGGAGVFDLNVIIN